ncbi:hypothetical protein [Mycobacteroides abscessus]|nr:hypothetical protein [Mycobacteroides abscessus]
MTQEEMHQRAAERSWAMRARVAEALASQGLVEPNWTFVVEKKGQK